MITGEELLKLCDRADGAWPEPLLLTRQCTDAVRAYVAQEAAREAAVAWAEASINLDTNTYKARAAYIALRPLRAARPTETDGVK